MAKLLKIVGRIIGISFEWLLIFIISLAFLIRSSLFQTYLAKQATAYLSTELNTKISVEKLEIVFLDKIALKGVKALDQSGETLISTAEILVTFDKLNFSKNEYVVSKVLLSDGSAWVYKSKKEGEFNFQFIVDYFSSDAPPSKSKSIILTVNSINLANFDLRYDDLQKEVLPFGLDYDHLRLSKLNLEVGNLTMKDDVVAFSINNLSFKERCGFEAKQFKTSVYLSSKGIRLKKFTLKTAQSNLYFSKLNLLFSDWSAFDAFEDKAKFDIDIQPSTLDLTDVSYFVSAMEGMTDKIRLSAKVVNPIKNLSIQNLDLRVGKQTLVQGTINLPDFRKGNTASLSAYLQKTYVSLADLEAFRLPKGTAPLKFEAPVSKLQFIDIEQLAFNGSFEDFKLKVKEVKTELGDVNLLQAIHFENKNDIFKFYPTNADSMAINVTNFNLGSFLDNTQLGLVSGKLKLNGDVNENGDFAMHNLFANLSRFDFNNYAYTNISVQDGELANENLFADLKIKDPNLDLAYNGNISIGAKQKYEFDLQLDYANLFELNLSSEDSSRISTQISGRLEGESFENIAGNIQANFLQFQQSGDELNVPVIKIDLQRQKNHDVLNLNSSILSFNLTGNINYETVLNDFLEDLSLVFPSIGVTKKIDNQRKLSDFNFNLKTGDLSEFLVIFVPDLTVEKGTSIRGNYHSINQTLNLDLNSGFVKFQDLTFDDIAVTQNISKTGIIGDYNIATLKYGDSLSFDKIRFETTGKNGSLDSKLSWNPNSNDYSSIEWKTVILENNQLNFSLSPSFFSLNGLRWEIANASDIMLTEKDLMVTNFKLVRNEQLIKINGCLSNNDLDILKIDIQRFNLAEISKVLGLGINAEGQFSGWAKISNPYTNLVYQGDAHIDNLKLDGQEVGNINLLSDWNDLRERIIISGDLEYRGMKTFDFGGLYSLKTENLDLFLNFDNTDIQFANAFMDPSVVKDINGKLNGKVFIKGKADAPKLKGKLKLLDAGAQVELLGVNYKMNGEIVIEEDAFLINNMPIKDRDGNTASLVGTIIHDNFANFDLDLQFDFENDRSKKPLPNGQAIPLEKFMILNTKYKDGDLYFGKAYGRGTANISGSASNLDVTVDVQTKKGTLINFPMYGVSEIDESSDFVQFVQKGNLEKQLEDKIDFTGLNLDMKFRITPDAELKIIFNEQLNDEILAKGSGIIDMRLDQFNHVTLNGDYVIGSGSVYNFALGAIKQPFNIVPGSKITWTGDAVNAALDIKTNIALKKVSILELSPEQLDKSLSNQDVNCYLNLTETLLKPVIAFDIDAPSAPETGKALIARVKNDPDELNRQFFSLLLVRKFQPLKGSLSAGSSAALDLLESQINSALGSLSDKYKLNVDYGADETLGETSVGVGLKTGFLNDRLIVSGSFGVESKSASSAETKGTSSLIGDVSVEYLVNEKGTFRANAFNKSNTNSVKENAGPFTQGAGISYREDFNSWDDFELYQFIANIFRKNKKELGSNKRKQSPVPPLEPKQAETIIKEEKE